MEKKEALTVIIQINKIDYKRTLCIFGAMPLWANLTCMLPSPSLATEGMDSSNLHNPAQLRENEETFQNASAHLLSLALNSSNVWHPHQSILLIAGK